MTYFGHASTAFRTSKSEPCEAFLHYFMNSMGVHTQFVCVCVCVCVWWGSSNSNSLTLEILAISLACDFQNVLVK